MVIYSNALDSFLKENDFIAKPLDSNTQYVVGAVYWDSYWEKTYKVQSTSYVTKKFLQNEQTDTVDSVVYLEQVTVKFSDGLVRNHNTALDAKNDYLLTAYEVPENFNVFDGEVYSTEQIKLWCVRNKKSHAAYVLFNAHLKQDSKMRLVPHRVYRLSYDEQKKQVSVMRARNTSKNEENFEGSKT